MVGEAWPCHVWLEKDDNELPMGQSIPQLKSTFRPLIERCLGEESYFL
jgi:hypothetical protein